ncbi:hypothetical protein ACFL09_07130 [Planctomycetota bacterium]
MVQLLRRDGSPAAASRFDLTDHHVAPPVVPVLHELATAPFFLSRSPGILTDCLSALASLTVATVTTIKLDVPCRCHPT